MSAFIVSPRHIDFIVSAAYTWRAMPDDLPHTRAGAAMLAAQLEAENRASVNARYNENDGMPDAPRSVQLVFEIGNPVRVLKAIACLEYQSCEHAGWPESDVKRWLNALRRVAIARLPGYKEAEWEIV
jgi:hypothetical protein